MYKKSNRGLAVLTDRYLCHITNMIISTNLSYDFLKNYVSSCFRGLKTKIAAATLDKMNSMFTKCWEFLVIYSVLFGGT